MKSKQKSTKADVKEEAAESSTKSNIYVEAEYNVDESEKKQGDRPPQIQRPTNPQVLSDSSNKFGSQKERQDPQQMMKKKKKFGPRNKNKNKNAWNSNIDKTETDDSHYQRLNHNNHVHRQHRDAEKIGTVTDNDYHPNASQNNDRHHYRDIKTQRNDTGRHVRSNDKHHGRHHHNWNRHRRQANNREFVSHGEVVSNPSEFQPPFLQYDPDSRFPFPTQTPQQQQMFAADGEAKNLLEHDEYNDQNGNSSAWNNSIPLFTFPLDSWTDLIDSNTQIQGVLLSNDGNPPTVATLPSDVGDHLVKELLMQKEISKNHDKNNRGPTWNTSNMGEQKRLSKGKMSTGATNQGVTSPPVPFIQHGSVQSMSTSSRDVLLPSSVHQSNASEYGPHYGIYDPNSHHMQPHNGYVSFPSHENDSRMHMVSAIPYYPMMQYPMIYPYQHPETMHSAFSSESYGYAVPEYDGQGNQQDHPSNNGDQNEASTHPSVINKGVIDENETNHQENRNQVTPYRAGIYGRDENNSRRVSFSPVVLLPPTPATSSTDNN